MEKRDDLMKCLSDLDGKIDALTGVIKVVATRNSELEKRMNDEFGPPAPPPATSLSDSDLKRLESLFGNINQLTEALVQQNKLVAAILSTVDFQ